MCNLELLSQQNLHICLAGGELLSQQLYNLLPEWPWLQAS